MNLSEEELDRLAALNNDDLAPQPSNEEIFGAKMEALKNEYQSDNERYQKTLEDNQKEVQRSLQDKLAARRQRRARKNIEEKELATMNQ